MYVPLGVVGANGDFSVVGAHVEDGGGASMIVPDIVEWGFVVKVGREEFRG